MIMRLRPAPPVRNGLRCRVAVVKCASRRPRPRPWQSEGAAQRPTPGPGSRAARTLG